MGTAWISGQALRKLVVLTAEQKAQLESAAQERGMPAGDALQLALDLLAATGKPVTKRAPRKVAK